MQTTMVSAGLQWQHYPEKQVFANEPLGWHCASLKLTDGFQQRSMAGAVGLTDMS